MLLSPGVRSQQLLQEHRVVEGWGAKPQPMACQVVGRGKSRGMTGL